MNIDKLIQMPRYLLATLSFSSLMNIDKLIREEENNHGTNCFSSLMNIDKLILFGNTKN